MSVAPLPLNVTLMLEPLLPKSPPVWPMRLSRIAVVVVVSADSYARRQKLARERLRQAMQQAGHHATVAGMTESALTELLADES